MRTLVSTGPAAKVLYQKKVTDVFDYVIENTPNSPCFVQDGRLRLGDRILAVNGTSLVGADYQRYSNILMIFRTQYRAFSHDVTAAMLVYQNKETAAILVFQTNP